MLVYVQTPSATGRMGIAAAMEQCKTRTFDVHQSFAFEYPHSGMQHFYSSPKNDRQSFTSTCPHGCLAVVCFLPTQMPFQQPPQ